MFPQFQSEFDKLKNISDELKNAMINCFMKKDITSDDMMLVTYAKYMTQEMSKLVTIKNNTELSRTQVQDYIENSQFTGIFTELYTRK